MTTSKEGKMRREMGSPAKGEAPLFQRQTTGAVLAAGGGGKRDGLYTKGRGRPFISRRKKV